MKKPNIFCFLIAVLFASQAHAQFGQSFEVQANSGASTQNEDVKIFYAKFDAFIAQLKDSTTTRPDPRNMISNFVIFTETGIIMNDLEFHSVESCKKNIQLGKAALGPEIVQPWLYVDLESHINRRQLESILAFLRTSGIEYQFGKDEDYHPLVKQH